ncbi:MAG: hypothetical protein KGI71_02695 [Patescibacteria group bacterium]|nr:hypothetical protein [Patescibacteria group bacterium]MDE2173510.1 hypothetical protein [Patescibacteria group bacterium]
MSLTCDETGLEIRYGDVLMAGTRDDAEFYSALSRRALARIPDAEKRTAPCKPGDGGVNIHEASSSRSFSGDYTIADFILGEFRFSLSKETAEKYLSNHLRRYTALSGA